MKIEIKKPMIVVNGLYKHNEDEVVVRVDAVEAMQGKISFYREGGGFKMSTSREEFFECFHLMSVKEQADYNGLKPSIAIFENGEDEGPGKSYAVWPCIMSNRRWNGWTVPYFTKDVINHMFKVIYLDQYGQMDVTGTQMTPVLWLNDEGYFYDGNCGEFLQLSRITQDGTEYYAFDGYCWDRLDPTDDLSSRIFTPMFHFVKPNQVETDEDLAIEARKWLSINLDVELDDDDGIVSVMREHKDAFEEGALDLTWPDQLYLTAWFKRWECCVDA